VDEPTRAEAERQLAKIAAGYRPDEVKGFAQDLELLLNPDGNYSDQDRARRRGFTLGPQRPDGTSSLRGDVTPELRAGLTRSWRSGPPRACATPPTNTP
jgi:hypothetical protein